MTESACESNKMLDLTNTSNQTISMCIEIQRNLNLKKQRKVWWKYHIKGTMIVKEQKLHKKKQTGIREFEKNKWNENSTRKAQQ